jgi:branched-subunit amino acid aminotransferase/4-amino-4-deoxychorismate lyase
LTKPDENGKITYVTPLSKSILSSVTNRSLLEAAYYNFGWNVERRKIKWSEVAKGLFEEVVACGTAVVCFKVNVGYHAHWSD